MKTVAVIPIKLNSERVPNKNIKRFVDGTPLMHFIQQVCLTAKSIDETYVYCSDETVSDYMLSGIKFLKRPAYLDSDKANSIDILREFTACVHADLYLETHATAPFAAAASFDTCIKKVAGGHYDSAFCAKRLQSFLWKDGAPMNFDPGYFPRTQDLKPIYSEVSNAYVFTKDVFLEFGRRVGIKPYIHEVDEIEAIDIDYPIDFEIANAIYKEIISK